MVTSASRHIFRKIFFLTGGQILSASVPAADLVAHAPDGFNPVSYTHLFSAAKAFLAADNQENVTVLSLFDNEEIGSLTRQGADSTFLSDVLERVALCCGKSREELLRAIAGGFLLSADNAHAVHPDSPEKSDPTNRCYLNGGVVVKHSPCPFYKSRCV